MNLKPIKLKKLALFILVTLGIGMLGGILGGNTKVIYAALNKPPLSPPSIVFPIVWTILYILMGIGAYLLSEENHPGVSSALKIYWLQLIANALWSFVFWRLHAFTAAAILIGLIIILVILLILRSLKINKISAILFIPYLIWLLFALYLNIGFAILN